MQSYLRGPALVAAALAAMLAVTGEARQVAGSKGVVAIQAGTIHTVSGDTITGGGTILVREGKIEAVGQEIEIPFGARVVDYGPDAVVVPGLIGANSNLGAGAPSPRSAAPDVRAIDNLDLYSSAGLYAAAGGVTTVYTPPARGRLIAGQGAVVKLVGDDPEGRTLAASASVHGAISAEARTVPGFWEPPIPATVDVGMGQALLQLPRTTMGAILGLRELLALARGGAGEEQWGPTTGPVLAALIEAGTPWRIDAQSEAEIRALVRFFGAEELPLIIETGSDAVADFAEDLRAMGAKVVYEVAFQPETPPRDRPSPRVEPRPTYAAPAKLAAAGVPFALATFDETSPRHLLFAAGVASRGGLAPDAALRAITLGAAEVLGVADRVGSIENGKDADFCVLTGEPFGGGAVATSVLATWTAGETAYDAPESASTVVVSVDELHVGDGEVVAPGELLIADGKIVELGARVSRPRGARVVRGVAAMPGMIDARGHLGLAGARKTPSADFKLSKLVAPGDATDREVARAGVTTVMMAPRGESGAGSPVLAYRPAASTFEALVIEETAAVALNWKDSNRQKAGDNVRGVLDKAVEYDKKWREYHEAMKTWEPPAEGAEDSKDAEEKDKAEEKKNGATENGEKKEEEDSKDDDEGAADRDPLTGVWKAKLPEPPTSTAASAAEKAASEEVEAKDDDAKDDDAKDDDAKDDDAKDEKDAQEEKGDDAGATSDGKKSRTSRSKKAKAKSVEEEQPGVPLELTLVHEDGRVHGRLRCALFSKDLVRVEGTFEAERLVLEGLGSAGWIDIEGTLKKDKLDLQAMVGGESYTFEAQRSAEEVRRGQRPERRKVVEPRTREPRGKPREPNVDEKLEPLRRALRGDVVLMIAVDERDQILECVAYCEGLGIRPILSGANDAHEIADQLAGRVAGVLLSPDVLRRKSRGGLQSEVNRYAVLHNAGVGIAFHSLAESGAADLPLMASFAVSEGLSLQGALRALTSGAADMLDIDHSVGRLATGLDADVLLLDGAPLAPATSVLRTWVAGEEVR